MDGLQSALGDRLSRPGAAEIRRGAVRGRRSFLFLQGPISSFFDRLARALIARGHRVHRVNFHLGDQLFWRLPATQFRGRFEEWRGVVGELLDRHQVTDLVLHGDRRPYHIVAAEEARARGIAVIATDLGYVRPDWITVEYDGLTSYSRFPRDPAAIRALAAALPEPEFAPSFHTPFWMIAALDVAYNLGLVFGRPLYRHYRYHSICHPFVEYAGWLRSRPGKFLGARATAAAKAALEAAPGSYFLAPLQLATDYQIRAHSRFRDVREAVPVIIASFAAAVAAGADGGRKLVFVIHPLDNGLIGWHRLIARLAAAHGIADRVLTLHGGTPIALLSQAAGIVTINSTVGVTALYHGVPVKVLGNAVFDIAGLTCQEPLDAFWCRPPRPDKRMLAAFVRALIGTTQVRGGYYDRASQDCAIAGFVERLEAGPYPLPRPGAQSFAPRPPERTIVVAGVAPPLAVALARGLAEPGVRLCLVGADAVQLAETAEDCRYRGAVVETHCCDAAGMAAAAIAAIDRRSPVAVLVVGEALAATAIPVVAEPMACRGAGDIVLVDAPVGGAAGDAAAGRRTGTALRAMGAALRRHWAPAGVRVAVAVPGRLAVLLAAICGEPRLAALTADAAAARVVDGLRRCEPVIALPGPAAALRQALRRLLGRLGDAARALPPAVEPLSEPVDEAPLAGKSAPGD